MINGVVVYGVNPLVFIWEQDCLVWELEGMWQMWKLQVTYWTHESEIEIISFMETHKIGCII
jgi:hypothetical protein